MKNAKMKFFLPVGLSALALMAFQAPLSAQEMDDPDRIEQIDAISETAPDTVLPQNVDAVDEVALDGARTVGEIADDLTKQVETIGRLAEVLTGGAAVERNLPDSIDPIAREDLDRLDRLGVVGAQARIGEDILIIDRQIRRAEAIQTLIGYLGVEGFKLQYPHLAADLKDSPILLQADLTKAQLLAEIRAANSDEEVVKDVPQPRDDGSSFFDQASMQPPQLSPSGRPLPTGDNSAKTLDPAITALIEAEVAKATERLMEETESEVEPEPEYVPISLREVYGLNGELYAIIIHGEERIRVRAGDRLPNDTLIQSIEPDAMTILRRGQVTKIRIRG